MVRLLYVALLLFITWMVFTDIARRKAKAQGHINGHGIVVDRAAQPVCAKKTLSHEDSLPEYAIALRQPGYRRRLANTGL